MAQQTVTPTDGTIVRWVTHPDYPGWAVAVVNGQPHTILKPAT
jgi:hypothetical protein